jgi:hypothetical protein
LHFVEVNLDVHRRILPENKKPAGLLGRSGLNFLRWLIYLRQNLPPALDAHGDDGGGGVESTSP